MPANEDPPDVATLDARLAVALRVYDNAYMAYRAARDSYDAAFDAALAADSTPRPIRQADR